MQFYVRKDSNTKTWIYLKGDIYKRYRKAFPFILTRYDSVEYQEALTKGILCVAD